MYKYSESIDLLINRFEVMKEEYLSDEDYYEDIPYVFYESVFVNYIIMNIKNKDEKSLECIFNFIEDLLSNGDDGIKELVDVAVIESLVFEKKSKELIMNSKRYFGKKTGESFARFNQ